VLIAGVGYTKKTRKETGMRVKKAAAVTVACAIALAITSCSTPKTDSIAAPDASPASECGPLKEMTKVTLGVNPGAQDLVTAAIKDQGLDKKYNLDLDIKSFLNPPASATAVTQRSVDIGFGGTTSMAVARSQGSDVFLFGALASPSNGVFTPKNSPIKDIGDLKGKRLGSFSANNSATFAVLSAIAHESFGIPKLEDAVASLTVAPDAAVLGLMDQGELDAVLTGSTATVVTELTGKYKKIGDLSTEYIEATGTIPVHLALASTETYAADHCSELVAFSNAMRDGVEYVQSDDKAWDRYAESLKLTDPKAPKALQALLGENFRTAWDQKQVDGMVKLIESLIPILGADDFVKESPKGLFSLDYVATK
jgi:ABC-type nitrate/sulfonate/bicarbonate transport system substrate-binding protein